jgi:hypothetical protein
MGVAVMAELVGGFKVLKNITPVRFVARTPPVALINDDETEEVTVAIAAGNTHLRDRPESPFGKTAIFDRLKCRKE